MPGKRKASKEIVTKDGERHVENWNIAKVPTYLIHT